MQDVVLEINGIKYEPKDLTNCQMKLLNLQETKIQTIYGWFTFEGVLAGNEMILHIDGMTIPMVLEEPYMFATSDISNNKVGDLIVHVASMSE
ncbi:MAG: hypothetical protein H7X94_00980, partial [Vallitaleaceae bacterium]|nr:hypothetical protein [Vallitaleaceae bacterium]